MDHVARGIGRSGAPFRRPARLPRPSILSCAVVFSLIATAVIEMVLLQLKYDYFTGGFLQPYYLETWSQKLKFFGCYFLISGALLVACAALWAQFVIGPGRSPSIVQAYYFAVIFGGGLIAAALTRYKVYSYFSDAMDLRLATQIAGGSLLNLVRYIASDVAAVIVVILLAAATCVAIGHVGLAFIERKRRAFGAFNAVSPEQVRPPRQMWRTGLTVALCATCTMGTVIAVQADDRIEYGLEKTIAYETVVAAISNVYNPSPPDLDLAQFRSGAPVKTDSFQPFAGHVPEHPPNLFIFVLESARADILNRRVNGITVAPFLNKLAAHGSLFPRAYSHAGFTGPSLGAIFTGAQPGYTSPQHSLFAILKRWGYQVDVLSANGDAAMGIADATGMRAYSDHFFDASSAIDDRVYPSKVSTSLQLSDRRLSRQLIHVLAETDSQKPLFIYFNVQAGHFPYYNRFMEKIITQTPLQRSEIRPDRRSELESTYYNAMANADRFVQNAVTTLQQTGFLRKGLIVVIGDHGESLFRDGFLGHGFALNDDQTKIPLVVNSPGLATTAPIGETDVPGLILRQLSEQSGTPRKWEGHSDGVLQFVGNFEHPSQIGLVQEGGRRILIDLKARKIFLSDRQQWLSPAEALADERIRARLAILMAAWDGAHAVQSQHHAAAERKFTN